ncbi:alpha/beta fold hydrolase [Oceaniserpentilla sp. 4NH20-0058]|uniref:alpha/beta hydrolase n=1 Tax=Oceaniserpentilla sp. 4NH20-0058 TaxID=3127660 RepID=UPI003106D8A4
MKSSSTLFPVALMRAEVLSSKYIEDTYLLKPNNSPDLTAQVALSRLGYADSDQSKQGVPVVLLHGLYENRSCWLDQDLNGLAAFLLELGFDPWMLEFRGHGDSPVNNLYDKNTIEAYAQYDLSAAQQFISEQNPFEAIWLGQGAGGIAIATSLANKSLHSNDVLGVCLLNTQVSSFPISYYVPFLRSIKRIRQFFRKLNVCPKIGPEAEPKGVLLEQLRWSGLLSRWKSKAGNSFWSGLNNLSTPVLSFSGKDDGANPVKACRKLAFAISEDATIVLLSKEQGFSRNYGYTDLLKSSDAANDVWPKIGEWIETLKNERG